MSVRLFAGLAMIVATILSLHASAQTAKATSEGELRSAGGKQLSAPDLKRLFVGNTVYTRLLKDWGTGKAGSTVPTYYRDDKTRIVGTIGRGNREGVWWFEGDKYCVELRAVGTGHQCYSVWESRGESYFCLLPQGECIISVRVVPGNPEKL